MNLDNSTGSAWRRGTVASLIVFSLCLLGAAGLGFSCGSREPAGKSSAQPKSVDPQRARRATVVLRVERVAEHGGSKYHWVTVRPLRVLKNTTKTSFTKPLRVAYYGGKSGVPSGTSTIYLEPYGTGTPGYWRLLDGDGAVGVSHPSTR